MNRLTFLFFVMLFSHLGFAQKQVAFTIDDVPNSVLYNSDGFKCRLLQKIDSMNLPVAIFINEQRIFSTDSITKNINLFNDWIKSPNVTVGNHGYSHAMYSSVGIEAFKADVLKGESISKELAAKQHKQEKYFRFPYNDLGMDASQHETAATFLKANNYIITPFTVTSDDWFVARLYEYYRSRNMPADAARIGHAFVAKTLEYFDYIEALTDKKMGRVVKHIYLMHDNALNAGYLDELISALKKKGYGFITLDDAMTDPVYLQEDHFQEKPGISWVYRWIKDKKQRDELMKQAPNLHDFETELEKVSPSK